METQGPGMGAERSEAEQGNPAEEEGDSSIE